MATLREHGMVNVEEAQWVVLETDTTFSMIAKGDRAFSKAEFEQVSSIPYKNPD